MTDEKADTWNVILTTAWDFEFIMTVVTKEDIQEYLAQNSGKGG